MKNNLKILLVDDDVKNSMLLKRFIEAEGFEVTYANNGKVGLIPFTMVFTLILYCLTSTCLRWTDLNSPASSGRKTNA